MCWTLPAERLCPHACRPPMAHTAHSWINGYLRVLESRTSSDPSDVVLMPFVRKTLRSVTKDGAAHQSARLMIRRSALVLARSARATNLPRLTNPFATPASASAVATRLLAFARMTAVLRGRRAPGRQFEWSPRPTARSRSRCGARVVSATAGAAGRFAQLLTKKSGSLSCR